MRVLIVDDEPLARAGLRRELAGLPGLTVAGECGTRDEAVEAIVETRPDVALLDIQLGRGSAFEVIEQVGADAMPLVIFVTAHDRYAVHAFEVHAVDYILKPVDPVRLREALDRAAWRLTTGDEAQRADRLEALLEAGVAEGPGEVRRRTPEPLERLVVRDGQRLIFLDATRVDWVEALGNRVRLHVGRQTHLLRTTMARLHRNLGEHRFVRIRRSALVNVAAVTAVEPYGKGSYLLTLRSGEQLRSSRYHLAALRELLRPLR